MLGCISFRTRECRVAKTNMLQHLPSRPYPPGSPDVPRGPAGPGSPFWPRAAVSETPSGPLGPTIHRHLALYSKVTTDLTANLHRFIFLPS